MKTVSVAKDFTRFPAGRLRTKGNTSGEEFRERFLEEPLRGGEPVTVDLDGTVGYGSSFLDEAFGGLVRKLKIPPEDVLNLLTFQSDDPALVSEITDYIRTANRARK